MLCTPSTLQLTVTSRSSTYPTGAQPVLGLSVTNSGSQACTQDVSGSKQVFSVYSAAGARVWSTADCFPGTGTEVRTLQPTETVQYNIRWAGTTSRPGCAGERTAVPAGVYQVRAVLGSLSATPIRITIG
ncbi:MAG: hypothetical protein WKF57_11705 [Nakamurella sp.]